MKLRTWCGSVVETKNYPLVMWWRWLLGWVRGGWTKRARELRREARQAEALARIDRMTDRIRSVVDRHGWQFCRYVDEGAVKCGNPADTDHPDGRCAAHWTPPSSRPRARRHLVNLVLLVALLGAQQACAPGWAARHPDDVRLIGCIGAPLAGAVTSAIVSLLTAAAGAHVDAGEVGLNLLTKYGAPVAACAVDRAWAELRRDAGELGAAGKVQADGSVLRARAVAPSGPLDVVRRLATDRSWLEPRSSLAVPRADWRAEVLDELIGAAVAGVHQAVNGAEGEVLDEIGGVGLLDEQGRGCAPEEQDRYCENPHSSHPATVPARLPARQRGSAEAKLFKRSVLPLARHCRYTGSVTLIEWTDAACFNTSMSERHLMPRGRKTIQIRVTATERRLLEDAAKVEAEARGTDRLALGTLLREDLLRIAKRRLEEKVKVDRTAEAAGARKGPSATGT